MGQQRDASYYDAVWARGLKGPVVPHAGRWRVIADWIVCQKFLQVIDVGCGPGYLAVLLQQLKYPLQGYLGIDLSAVAVMHAQQHCAQEGYTFVAADALTLSHTNWPVLANISAVWVFCELLEHITEDLALLQHVPLGAGIAFTVPTFDDPGHVRHFLDLASVRARYGVLCNLFELRQLSRVHILGLGRRTAEVCDARWR